MERSVDIHLTILSIVLSAVCATAGVPLKWDVDTTKTTVRQFDAWCGETLELEATLCAYRSAIDLTGKDARIYWQTNGMGSVYWQTNATVVASNVLAATFTPHMNPGARAIMGFIGVAGEIYRAAFSIRFNGSPGATPSAVPLPAQTLDFARITVLNPPWGEGPGNYAAVSNAAMNAVQPSELVAATNGIPRITPSQSDVFPSDWAEHAVYASRSDSAEQADQADLANRSRGLVDASGVDTRTSDAIFAQLDAATSTNAAQSAALATQASQLSQQSQSLSTLGSQVSAIGAHLNAEDAHFVSTNYDSAVHLPEAYVEINMSNSWITIWREMTRWDRFVGGAFDWTAWNGFHAWAENVSRELSFKADRAWGVYDSETGGYSPEGYTQISSSNILIAAGMAYQRTATSAGSVWVLQCNSGTATLGGDTNGFFRVIDGDGNTQFEIVKGDRLEMGCDASGIIVGQGSPPIVTIPYSVEAEDHPTLRICDSLTTANWIDETDNDCIANVTWSGTSGAYVATVQRKAVGNGAMFVKATYMAGAETYIRNNAPVSMGAIILNGTKYYLGTATIDGHTVLTLSTTPPSP